MIKKDGQFDLSHLPHDVIFDEAVSRLKAIYRNKSGKEPYRTSFTIELVYDAVYEITVSNTQSLFRAQPTLQALPELN